MLLDEIGYWMIGAVAALLVALLVMIGRHIRWSEVWACLRVLMRWLRALMWWLWCWLPQCVFALMVMITILAAAGGAPPLAVAAVFLPALLGSSLLAAIGRQAKGARDRGMADRLVMHLQRALRLNVPLSPWMRAAARDEREPFRWVMLELADALDAGQPVGTALVAVVPSMDLRTSNLLSSADSLGRLPAMMDQLAQQQSHDERQHRRAWGVGLGWVFVPCVAMLLVIAGVYIFIVPKFEMIFRDYETPAPAFIAHLFELEPDDVLPPLGYWLFLAMFACLAGYWLLGTRLVRGPFKPGFIQVFRDRLIWMTPLLRQIDRDDALGDVCLLLSQATLANVPLSTAARHATHLPVNELMRRKVDAWTELQTQGIAPAAAARVAGLPVYLQQMLAFSQDRDSLPQALAMLAEHYHDRATRRLVTIRQFLLAVVYIVVVVMVAALCYWVIQSLGALMWSAIHQSLMY